MLNQYPMPTLTQAPGTSFNYSQPPVGYDQLEQQPVVKIDYNLTSKLRFSGVLSEDRLRPVVQIGLDSRLQRCLHPVSLYHPQGDHGRLDSFADDGR